MYFKNQAYIYYNHKEYMIKVTKIIYAMMIK